jgi:hypothetical protein
MEPPLTVKSERWKLLHSLWIGWTFTLGFFSWVAFVYIGIRARHPRWVLWGLLYATPLILFAVLIEVPTSWTNLTLSATVVLGVVSIVHAFLVRKDYLLRLELLERETSNVSVTSRGKRWELLHSLWMGWTFTLFFGWVAFIYIRFRARRYRWILWGLLYLTVFIVFVTTSPASEIAQATTSLMIVAGIVSIVHAFMVRNDYMMSLEYRMHEAAQDEASRHQRLEAEYRSHAEEAPSK